MGILNAESIVVKINNKEIIHGLSLQIPLGHITSIVGPNGCGKSTTLKALAHLLPCASGRVTYNGEDIKRYSRNQFAREVAILTQSPKCPEDLTVLDLVEMGRFPHRSWYAPVHADDEQHVNWAMEQTGIIELRNRLLITLSGGERQRAWIAMALAQRPKVLLLDEPTTYLDISHQLEVMQLLRRLNTELGLTVVMVVHDLNHAVQFSDCIAVIKNGSLVAEGESAKVVNAALLKDVFSVQADEFMCSNGKQALLPIDLVK